MLLQRNSCEQVMHESFRGANLETRASPHPEFQTTHALDNPQELETFVSGSVSWNLARARIGQIGRLDGYIIGYILVCSSYIASWARLYGWFLPYRSTGVWLDLYWFVKTRGTHVKRTGWSCCAQFLQYRTVPKSCSCPSTSNSLRTFHVLAM